LSRKRSKDGQQPRPRRGKRRSIRFDAHEDDPATSRRSRAPEAPPAIHLRRLPAEEALDRLDSLVPSYLRAGRHELLVVHGRGHHSPGGQSVLGPLVREWCENHPDLVASWRPAPAAWGGEGAIVIVLRDAG
jgi:DNA-nicking Smr family endonuclease